MPNSGPETPLGSGEEVDWGEEAGFGSYGEAFATLPRQERVRRAEGQLRAMGFGDGDELEVALGLVEEEHGTDLDR